MSLSVAVTHTPAQSKGGTKDQGESGTKRRKERQAETQGVSGDTTTETGARGAEGNQERGDSKGQGTLRQGRERQTQPVSRGCSEGWQKRTETRAARERNRRGTRRETLALWEQGYAEHHTPAHPRVLRRGQGLWGHPTYPFCPRLSGTWQRSCGGLTQKLVAVERNLHKGCQPKAP